MNAAHTPGPWVQISINEHGGACVATVEPAPETMEAPNYWAVANANPLRAEWAANARLIAAAPDMLEALLMLRACKRSNDRDAWDDACDAADAAIKKAKPAKFPCPSGKSFL
jgi:Xaa-Pro aminopeptidase